MKVSDWMSATILLPHDEHTHVCALSIPVFKKMTASNIIIPVLVKGRSEAPRSGHVVSEVQGKV